MTRILILSFLLTFVPQAVQVPVVPPCARPAALVRVIDGDTWILNIDLGYDLHAYATIREEGLFAPELHENGGFAAKTAVEGAFRACPDQIRVEETGHRSFARWVGRTFICGVRVAERMK